MVANRFGGDVSHLTTDYKTFYHDQERIDATHQLFATIINTGEPCAIAKLGDGEWEGLRLHVLAPSSPMPRFLNLNAGVYPPTAEMYDAWFKHFTECLSELDYMATGNYDSVRQLYQTLHSTQLKDHNQQCLYHHLQTCGQNFPARSLEPYYVRDVASWTQGLANKRVLVISPFTDTICQQYQDIDRRRGIWGERQYLPDFTLLTIKAPFSPALSGQTQPPHPDWFSALQAMITAMKHLDFDVALIGAGAYSIPLAVAAKRLGKIGIHMGGALQILFGIRGARWDINSKVVQSAYNDAWTRPSAEERPSNYRQLENGGYW